MIVSSVISRPVQVSVLSNTYAVNIAALKAIDISEMAGNTQISVAGYYTPGDGGDGVFYYDAESSSTDNGGTVIAPDVGSGRWKRIYSGAASVKWFGAKGDGTTDDTAAFSALLADSSSNISRTMFIPFGKYRITSALNLTNRGGPYTVVGEGNSFYNGSVLYGETGGVCIDCTGSSHITLKNFAIVSNGRSNYSKVGVLFSRSTTSGFEYSQFNHMEDVWIFMEYDITANGGVGTVAYYNKSAEQNSLLNVSFQADNPLVFTGNNIFSITSPYRTINDSIQSCGLLTVDGSSSIMACRNETRAPVLLNGAYAVTFNNTYFQGTGFGGANNRAIVAIGCNKVHINNGNMELLNSVAYLENCTDVILNVACVATTYAPIEIGASKYAHNLTFKPYPVGTPPITTWPRFIHAGTGASHYLTRIEVPGDDGSVSGSDCTDIRGFLRFVKGASSGLGGYKNVHLPGNPVIEEAVVMTAVSAALRPNNSLFLDSADGVLKFKDSGGTVHALW